MGVNNKPSAIGKPRPDNLPIHLLTLMILRLRDDACLACRDELESDPLRVTVCHVFAIGRNCPTCHRVFERIDGELPKLGILQRLYGWLLVSGEPDERQREGYYKNSARKHWPSDSAPRPHVLFHGL